jgi:hypothetical protein
VVAGTFEVISFPEDSRSPTEIGFRQLEGIPASPEDTAFAIKVSSRLRSLKKLTGYRRGFEANPVFRDNFTKLLGTAKTGINHPQGDLALGEAALKDFEDNSLIDAGRAYRNRFFVLQSIYLLLLTVCAFVIIRYSSDLADDPNILKVIKSGAYAAFGIVVSVFLAAFWRNRTIRWDNIDYLDPDAYPPWLRLLGVGLLCVVLMFLLNKRAFILGLGATPLNDFLGDPENSVLIGFLCGLSELPVVKLVQKFFDNPTINPR